jgi:putative phosphoesterase
VAPAGQQRHSAPSATHLKRPQALRVGVLSDTHGLLRPEARAFLLGCDHIIHGGDVGTAQVLEDIAAIAPLTAVRGNNDTGPWARKLRETELIRLGGVFAYVIHDLAQLDVDPQAARVSVIVSGHSHVPKIEQRAGILFVNPGSCGPRRFRLPISVAELTIGGTQVRARTLTLPPMS